MGSPTRNREIVKVFRRKWPPERRSPLDNNKSITIPSIQNLKRQLERACTSMSAGRDPRMTLDFMVVGHWQCIV